MTKYVATILLGLALAACQSTNEKSSAPDTSSSKKINGGDESGGLFSTLFRSKEPRAIMLPPDLVSSANDKVRENHEAASRQEQETVLPAVAAASVVADGERRWLRVETDAQAVWDRLVEFWSGEQIDLVEFKPAAGLMETDWIENNNLSKEDQGRTFARMFKRITGQGVTFDKYKLRLERESEGVTLVYITHRATARVEKQPNSPIKITEWEWVEKESDEEKVAQLLQVMVLLFQNTA
jgi:uncharacterized lipoprotein